MINLDNKAVDWFKKEIVIPEDKALRFYVRYGGDIQLKQGFSPAFTVDTPNEKDYIGEVEGLKYFIDEKDLWYYQDHELLVTINNEEITYQPQEA